MSKIRWAMHPKGELQMGSVPMRIDELFVSGSLNQEDFK